MVHESNALQCVIKTAQKIINGVDLLSIEDLGEWRCPLRVINILKDSFHFANALFTVLPSGRHFSSISTRTTRVQNGLFPLSI